MPCTEKGRIGRMFKKVGIIAIVLLLVVLGGAYYLVQHNSSNEPSSTENNNESITITDLAGKTVKLKTPIERIVLVRSRDIYELSALLGDELPKKLIAWGPDIKTADKDAYDKFVEKYPELKNLTEVGDIFKDAINPEQIMALNPDLVIMDTFMIERGYKCVGKLQEAGLPLVFFDGSSDPLKSPQKSIALLGKILGKEKKAREIVEYVDGQINTVYAQLSKINKPMPSVYLETGNQGPSTFSNTYGSYGEPKAYSSWGSILQHCKVKNIADGVVKNMAPINPEYVLKANPDIIIISGAYWPTPSNTMRLGYYAKENESKSLLSGFQNRPGWDTLSAVKNKKVYSLFHGFTMHIFDFAGLQGVVKYCYPEEFKDLNPEKNLKEFHEKFLPIKYDGTWMVSVE